VHLCSDGAGALVTSGIRAYLVETHLTTPEESLPSTMSFRNLWPSSKQAPMEQRARIDRVVETEAAVANEGPPLFSPAQKKSNQIKLNQTPHMYVRICFLQYQLE
jgi:hypothetical protein